jgi:uncharacterized protein (DUF58 family)
VVTEKEAQSRHDVVLELALPAGAVDPIDSTTDQAIEHALSVLASLAERLLANDWAVGVRTAGTTLHPSQGERQRLRVLLALSRLQASDPMPLALASGATRICLVGPVSRATPGADHTFLIPAARS